MTQITWILRFGELGLKSKTVRGSFQRALVNNMLELARRRKIELFVDKIRSQYHVSSTAIESEVEDLLCHIIGIVAVDKIIKLDCGYNSESIAEVVSSKLSALDEHTTFGVRIKRMYKYGEKSSKDYEKEIGKELLNLHHQLSVNLSNPDIWIKLLIGSEGVFQIVKRFETSGGLPTGIQGDVLVNLKDEFTMLESYMIMRRGVRIIPVMESKVEFVEQLSRFDPFVGHRTNERDRVKFSHKRPAWGVIGMSIEDAEPYVGKRESSVKTTPMSTLSPLQGWTENEISQLKNHFYNPYKNSINLDFTSWLS